MSDTTDDGNPVLARLRAGGAGGARMTSEEVESLLAPSFSAALVEYFGEWLSTLEETRWFQHNDSACPLSVFLTSATGIPTYVSYYTTTMLVDGEMIVRQLAPRLARFTYLFDRQRRGANTAGEAEDILRMTQFEGRYPARPEGDVIS